MVSVSSATRPMDSRGNSAPSPFSRTTTPAIARKVMGGRKSITSTIAFRTIGKWSRSTRTSSRHPGIPTVYWKHFFDWGAELRNKITALINARKVAGVHAGSALHLQNNARSRGVYAAMIEGTKGELYVRVGGSDNEWQPSMSNYSDYREYAYGAGWKVWVKLPGNPPFRQGPLRGALPVPTYRPPS